LEEFPIKTRGLQTHHYQKKRGKITKKASRMHSMKETRNVEMTTKDKKVLEKLQHSFLSHIMF
jgi:hypothetical protein